MKVGKGKASYVWYVLKRTSYTLFPNILNINRLL